MCFGCYRKRIIDTELRQATKEFAFSYNDRSFTAKVVSVYDGDTMTVVFRNYGRLEQHNVRLLGIDTPEMKPPLDMEYRALHIQKAVRARDALMGLVEGKLVHIKCGKFDKYGRILVKVRTRRQFFKCISPIDVNQWMLDNKYGVPYDGGTKQG